MASRLEGITKQYGVNMIVDESTRAAVPEVVFCEIGKVNVKGKEARVAIFEPIGLSGEIEKTVQDGLKLWGQVLSLYRVRDWDMAELQSINFMKVAPGRGLYRLFLERVAHLRKNSPDDGWDGSWKFETK